MTTEAQLLEWKRSWRQLLSGSLGRAFDAIEERLPSDSPKASELLLLKARLNEVNRAKVLGVMTNEDLQLKYNRIRLHLLEWIDGLEVADFTVADGGLKPKGSGVLLHKIPRQMEVGKEEVCTIRLAYDRKVIADNLELTEAVEIREVAVSEVMEAELIDANSQPAFRIRTYHDERQFLETGTYTEWKFYVEPIREGTFRLLLKLTVIEEVMGKRERRNITWEEEVQIFTEQKATEPATFRSPGIALSAPGIHPLSPTHTGSTVPDIDETSRVAKRQPSAAREEPVAPQTEAPPPKPATFKRQSLARRLSIAASVVLIVGFGGLYLLSLSGNSTTGEGSPGTGQPSKTVEPAEPSAPGEEASVEWSGNLARRRVIHSEPLPPRPATTAVFEVCIAPSGKVTAVTPQSGGSSDPGWTAQMVNSLKIWTFEPAPEPACGTLTYLSG